MGDRRFDDDFTARVKKQISNSFRKNVKPLDILPHLTCIDEEDEEFIRAQHNNLGDIKTADILLNLIVTKDNWYYNLIDALRNEDVGCRFLAEEFEDIILTIPARWNIASFEDKYGIAYVDGQHCPSISDGLIDLSLTDVKFPVKANAESVSQLTTVAAESPGTNVVPQEVTVSEKDHEKLFKKRKEEIELRRQEIALRRKEIETNIMEHIQNGIRGPSDLPTAIAYFKEIKLIFKETDVGSLLLKFRIQSLSQLEKLEDLWRFGALKKLFDKDVLSHERIKELEENAKTKGHPVHNITSDLIIRQSDIERCKAWLKHTNTNHNAHVDMVDGLSLSSSIESRDPTTTTHTQAPPAVFRYANSRLPTCLKAMIEDPFLLQRVQDFYSLPELQDKMQAELNGKATMETKSVAEIFLTWFQEEVINYVTKIGQLIINNVVKIAALVHISIQKQNTSLISEVIDPNDVLSEYKEMVDGKIWYKIVSTVPGVSNGLLGCTDIPPCVNVEEESIGNICQILTEKGILYRCQNGYKFVSQLLRDMFLSRFISIQDVLNPDFDFDTYPFLLHVLGFEEHIPYDTVSVYHENIHYMHNNASFAVVKSITSRHISDGREAVFYKGKDDYYIPDMIDLNEWTESDLSSQLKATRQFFDMKCTADLSVAAFAIADDVELINAFHWINILDCLTEHRLLTVLEKRLKVSIHDLYRCVDVAHLSFQTLEVLKDVRTTAAPKEQPARSGDDEICKRYKKSTVRCLNMSGQTPKQTGMNELSRLLVVTPNLTKLSLHDCKLSPAMLTENFKSGNFEHVVHLDISNNPEIGNVLQVPIGLMFLPNLVALEIQNCGLEDKGICLLADDLRYVHKLRVLNVSYNSMTAKGLLELSTGLSGCTGITSLRLQKSNLGFYGSVILASWLKKLVLLEVLNISDCKIDDNGIELITESIKGKAILKLSTRNNHFRRQVVFKKTFQATLLNHFDYSENPVYDSSRILPDEVEDQESFEKFLQGPFQWRHLSFWKCNLGYRRVFQSVEEYQSLASLRYICLQENYIGDEFLCDLSACVKKHCQLLSHVNVRQNQISDIGINALAAALKNQNFLAEIFLDRNCFRDEGAESILNCCLTLPSFKKLDVSCNNVSKYMISEAVRMFSATSTPEIEPNTFIVRKENGQAFVDGYTA